MVPVLVASLAPVLLVSMPQMLDPNFSKTVVLLAEYGALQLLNYPTLTTAILQQYANLYPVMSRFFNLADRAAVVASHRIFKTLDQPIAVLTPEKPVKTERARGRIEFENVWFAYKDEDWVLKDVSFTVEPGQSIALVGHTGSGKTTITNLLMRFYDIQRGRILLDGVDLREWDLRALRKNFAVVLQEVFLFSGTIEGNIRLGREDITEERVRWAAQEVHADGFIRRLKDEYQAEVRERGAGLSVGQKQLISFARALAFDPALLILDEATSNLDTESEQLIQAAMASLLVLLGVSLVTARHSSSGLRAETVWGFIFASPWLIGLAVLTAGPTPDIAPTEMLMPTTAPSTASCRCSPPACRSWRPSARPPARSTTCNCTT